MQIASDGSHYSTKTVRHRHSGDHFSGAAALGVSHGGRAGQRVESVAALIPWSFKGIACIEETTAIGCRRYRDSLDARPHCFALHRPFDMDSYFRVGMPRKQK